MEWLESRAVRPRQARYQAALRPDMKCTIYSKALSDFLPAPTHGFLASTVHLPYIYSLSHAHSVSYAVHENIRVDDMKYFV